MTNDPLNTQHSTRPFENLSLSANKLKTILQVMVANTKIGILVVVKIPPNEDFTDSGDW